MTNVASNTVPDRVDNFGSKGRMVKEPEEPLITPDNLEKHANKLPRPTGYRILIYLLQCQELQRAAYT